VDRADGLVDDPLVLLGVRVADVAGLDEREPVRLERARPRRERVDTTKSMPRMSSAASTASWSCSRRFSSRTYSMSRNATRSSSPSFSTASRRNFGEASTTRKPASMSAARLNSRSARMPVPPE